MPDPVDAIISIYPTYADAILSGNKKIELRRRVPRLASGTRLWIYATRPTGAVVGFVTIQAVEKAHPAIIWKMYGDGTGVDHASFKDYFNGSKEAVAILLAAAQRVGPISVDQLRKIRSRFHPPQVLTRLTASEAKALRKLASDSIFDGTVFEGSK